MSRQTAVGLVSEKRVRLQRVIPLMQNSFKPFFIGRFEQRGADVYLTGHFTMLWSVKVFITLWLLFTLAFGVFALTGVVSFETSPDSFAPARLIPLCMFVFGVVLVTVGKWFARNDAAWLSDVFRRVLQAEAVAQITVTRSLASASSRAPFMLRLVALALCAYGTLSLAAVVAEESSSVLYRMSLGVIAILIFGLAIGVYRRQEWAWRAGFVFLGGGLIFQFVRFLRFTQLPETIVERLDVRIFMGVAMLAVTAYWGWWWYAQRAHFQRGDLS